MANSEGQETKNFMIRKFFEGFPAWEMALMGRKDKINIVIGCLVGYLQSGTCSRRHLKLEQQKEEISGSFKV